MVKQDRYYGVDRYLPHALLATTAIVAIPLLVVVALLVALEGELAPLLAGVVGFALALIVAGIGSVLWSRGPGALDMAFSELLIWGWYRRKRADERAARDARLLGLDSDGRPKRPARSARAQQLAILGDLSSALESKDPYTHGHSQRVERHTTRTAAELGLSVDEISELRRAAALHDVGKIRVPHRILRKPGSLTVEERKIIEQHSSVGAWLVSNVCKRDVVAAVRHHHERWDGRGYPDGLAGEEIPLYARIIAVADTFDAMTSTRPYRVAYDSRTAMGLLQAEAGAQFDPRVVRAFIATVPDRVPIAALLPFFGAGLLRKLGGSVRRALDGAAASGIAAGAATLLVASLMSPVPSPLAGPDEEPGSSPPAVMGPATPSDMVAASGDVDKSELRSGAKSKAKKGDAGKDVKSGDRERAKKKAGKRDAVVLSDTVNRGGGGSSGGGSPTPPPQSGGGGDGGDGGDGGPPNPPPAPPEPPAKDRSSPPSDPQPTRGKDCPSQGPGGHAPGRNTHCG